MDGPASEAEIEGKKPLISEDQAPHSESDLLTSTGGAEAAWGLGRGSHRGSWSLQST